MKNLSKISLTFAIFVFAFSTFAAPAKAFYLEVPKSLTDLVNNLKSKTASAQDSGIIAPAPQPLQPSTEPTELQAPQPPQPMLQPAQPVTQDNSFNNFQPQPQGDGQQFQQNPKPPMSGGDGGQFGSGGPGQPGSGGQFGPGGTGQNQGMDPNQGGMGKGQNGPNEEQQKQNQDRQLKDMKRNVRNMQMGLKSFKSMVGSAEKKGTVIPQEIKDTANKVQSTIDTISSAASADDLQNVDMGGLGDMIQTLDQYRQDVLQKAQQLEGMKRGMKGMQSGIKMFEKQIAKLTKQGIAIPAEVKGHIDEIKAAMDKINNSQSIDDVQNEMDSLPDLMDNLNQDRQQLEMLARWPQTLKQVDRELTRLNQDLKRSKSTVDRLAKKGIDVSDNFNQFQEAANKLKAVRDDAVAKMQAGNAQDAFDALENDFFGQMDDVRQNQQVIDMMSNLGRFTSDYKQGISTAKRELASLNKKGVDTADLKDLYDQAVAKGNEILSLLKIKPIDVDAILAGMEELQNNRQDFENKVQDLGGEQGQPLPWEQGPQQFQKVELSPSMQRYMPTQEVTNQGNSGPMTAVQIPTNQ